MTAFRFPNESDEYRAKRDELLDAEVELRAHVERVAAQRRALPLGGRVETDYVFKCIVHGEPRDLTLAELFGPHSTLIFYTMMFGPEWDAPCPSCTSIVDAMNTTWHSIVATTAIAVVASAGADALDAWASRRGWTIPLVSAHGTSYIRDYAGFDADDAAMVSCMNVFRRTRDGVFHFWASELLSRPMENGHPRHVDSIWPLWNLLDLTPEGRGTAIVPKQNFEHDYFTRTVLHGR